MTVEAVEAQVELVRVAAQDERDFEGAHGIEDRLLIAVLRAIAGGEVANPCEIATATVKVKEMKHPRWTA